MSDLSAHSFGQHTDDNPTGICTLCPGEHGGPGPCDHAQYSRKRIRHILAHREAYTAAYLNPDPRAASNELIRLEAEYRTLPPHHSCSCQKLNARGVYVWDCLVCAQLDARRPRGLDVALEIGRTSLINPPLPLVAMLDLEAGYTAA
jgi:hypothetical protein